jgi:hypothetical protein
MLGVECKVFNPDMDAVDKGEMFGQAEAAARVGAVAADALEYAGGSALSGSGCGPWHPHGMISPSNQMVGLHRRPP